MRYSLRCDDGTFRSLVKKHTNRASILRELGYAPGNGSTNRILNKRVSALGLDTSHWKLGSGGKKRTPTAQLCLPDIEYSSSRLKERLWREGLLLRMCALCGLGELWQGKFLCLHMDHIDGNRKNNTLENLRILCPNCHQQTETHGTKSLKGTGKKWFCNSCGRKTSYGAKKCNPCNSKERNNPTKITWPSQDELIDRIRQKSITSVALELGVSNTAVRKRLKAARNS